MLFRVTKLHMAFCHFRRSAPWRTHGFSPEFRHIISNRAMCSTYAESMLIDTQPLTLYTLLPAFTYCLVIVFHIHLCCAEYQLMTVWMPPVQFRPCYLSYTDRSQNAKPLPQFLSSASLSHFSSCGEK